LTVQTLEISASSSTSSRLGIGLGEKLGTRVTTHAIMNNEFRTHSYELCVQ